MHSGKNEILDILHESEGALGLAEINAKLVTNATPRTLRRWLAELVNDKRIERIGKGPATRYQSVQHGLPNLTFDFSETAKKSISHIQQPLIKRSPVAYNTDWLSEYTPNKTSYFSADAISDMQSKGSRKRDNDSAGTYARHIYNRLLIDLSYNSSRLEGNTYSLLDTEKLLLEGKVQDDKLNEETNMILNHKEAIRHLIDTAQNIRICSEQVKTIHYLLSDTLVPAKYAGHIRDHGVRISQSVYIPYENPKRINDLLEQICDKAQQIQNVFEQSLFLLAHLAYLQAFTDVNKRTSRLCANIPLIKENYVPLSFNDVDKEDYLAAMISIYELNDIKPLAELYRFSYIRTCENYSATIESLGFDEIRLRYRSERRALLSRIIAEQLTGDEMQAFIDKESKQIPTSARADFIDDLYDDINYISTPRLAGLGVSIEQYQQWKKRLK